mmetsp:Transcript_52965/g.127021  ORF Transcript_52965/g.127021 Transcript_52965/m.127021 type:complete len:283 (+) Transcript_52965:221-1069(+)|eukprot:scaffold49569_cov69-Phaeocystis_antarctica.AAC.7
MAARRGSHEQHAARAARPRPGGSSRAGSGALRSARPRGARPRRSARRTAQASPCRPPMPRAPRPQRASHAPRRRRRRRRWPWPVAGVPGRRPVARGPRGTPRGSLARPRNHRSDGRACRSRRHEDRSHVTTARATAWHAARPQPPRRPPTAPGRTLRRRPLCRASAPRHRCPGRLRGAARSERARGAARRTERLAASRTRSPSPPSTRCRAQPSPSRRQPPGGRSYCRRAGRCRRTCRSPAGRIAPHETVRDRRGDAHQVACHRQGRRAGRQSGCHRACRTR